jgi:DNA gyrase subunit A
VQAQAVLDMRLSRLAALERKKIEDELKEVRKLISYLEDLLQTPAKILALITQDLDTLREKFGDARRTRIMADADGELDESDLIPEIRVLVTLTDKGYIKRLPHDTYKRQRRGGRGITGIVTREMDAVQHMITCNTLDNLLFLTDKGRIFTLKAHEVPDTSRTAKGLPLVNLINLQPGEVVNGMISIPDFDAAEYLVIATTQGKIKRTALDAYSSVRSTGIIAINLEEGDTLAAARLTNGDQDLIMVTRKGQSIRFKETDVRPMGRDTTGVIAMRLDAGDYVIGFDVVRPGGCLLIVTDKGMGKRTPIEEFPVQGRAGSGVRAIGLVEKGGAVAVARMVMPDDDLVVISNKGIVIRLFAEGVNQLRRAAQGVQVQAMRAGDGVASIAIVPAEGDPADEHGAAATAAAAGAGELTGARKPSRNGRSSNGA